MMHLQPRISNNIPRLLNIIPTELVCNTLLACTPDSGSGFPHHLRVVEQIVIGVFAVLVEPTFGVGQAFIAPNLDTLGNALVAEVDIFAVRCSWV